MMFICAVRDSAVQAFMNPFVVAHTGAATRSFADEVNRPAADNAMNKHADDYDLYLLGRFDELTGVLTANPEGPTVILRGKDCLRSSS